MFTQNQNHMRNLPRNMLNYISLMILNKICSDNLLNITSEKHLRWKNTNIFFFYSDKNMICIDCQNFTFFLRKEKSPSVLETKHHGEEKVLGRPHCGPPVTEGDLQKEERRGFFTQADNGRT